MVTLHDFHRSSASFRVRIALNLKGIEHETIVHDLDAGVHQAPAYRSVNPQGLLPALVVGRDVLIQSAAILEYLDATFPDPPLLPETPAERARVRALFQIVAADMHPLTTMRVGRYLKAAFGCDEPAIQHWKQHWLIEGLSALETMLASESATGCCCHGDRPSLADVALVPQVVSMQKLGIAIKAFPTVSRIYEHCMQIPAFRDAHPENVSIPTQAK